MTTETKLTPVDRAKLTARIQAICKEYDAYRRGANAKRAELFMLAFQWVEATAAEDAVTTTAAEERLASMLKRKPSTVCSWHGCGKLMRENGIDYRTCQAGAVLTLYNCARSCSEASFRAAVKEIRAGKPSIALDRILNKDARLVELRTERKAKKLMLARQLTTTRLKLEMMAVATLARAFYGKDVLVALYDADDTELLTVK